MIRSPRFRLLCTLPATVLMALSTTASATPYHGVDAWFSFSHTPFAATNFVETRVNVTRNAPSQYYAVYWKYMFGGDGYMGLQSNGYMPVTGVRRNLFRFSLWSGNAFRNLKNGAVCGNFSHEGSGIQCAMPFAWSTSRWYVYQVQDRGADAGGRWWEASIKDEPTGRWYSLGEIRTPHTSFITEVVQFTESFEQPTPNDCASIRASEVVMVVPFGSPWGGTPARHTGTYYPSPCANGWSFSGYGAIAMNMGR